MKHNLLVLVVVLAAAADAPAAVLFTTAAAPHTTISELEGQRRASQLTTIGQASISSGHETGAAEAATAMAAEKTIRVRRTWPCCDRCGGCSTNSDPAECQCHDLVQRCHPSCRSCFRSPLSVEPPLFQCADRIPGYCRRRCNSDHDHQIL